LRSTIHGSQPVLPASARLYREGHVSSTMTPACLTAYQPRVAIWFGASTASCDRPHLFASRECHNGQSCSDFIGPGRIEMGLSQELLSLRQAPKSSSQLGPFPRTKHQPSWLPRLRNSFCLSNPDEKLALVIRRRRCRSFAAPTLHPPCVHWW
jgi:hypothetical protein